MQLHFLFARVGHVHPRNPASLLGLRKSTPFCTLGVKVCHKSLVRRGSSRMVIHNSFPIRTCTKDWHIYSKNWLRCMNTDGITFQGNVGALKDPSGVSLSTAIRLTASNEITSSTKLPVTRERSSLRYVQSRKEMVWHNRSEATGRSGHMNSQSLRRSTRRRTPNYLALWLDSRTRSERAAICAEILEMHLSNSRKISLTTILLLYLEGIETPASERGSLATTLDTSALTTLERSGFAPEDVDLWAYILTASTDEEVAERYLTCQSKTPTFVLLEILRRPRLSARSFSSLLLRVYTLMGINESPQTPESRQGVKDIIHAGHWLQLPSLVQSAGHNFRSLEYDEFDMLVECLIRHALQVWPSALASIANMFVAYCQHLFEQELETSPKIFKRACKMYNIMLLRLSFPATINPMKSMTYNWEAQRTLLMSAASLRPPLQLNRISYRAVSRVLLASQKSSDEKRYTSLLQRTWPPWRKELDGMDLARSPDEDLSRVVAVLSRMREAGYAEDASDRALKILGGREPDGTPTVQTRQFTKLSRRYLPRAISQGGEDSSVEWAARIIATRDVYEAWEAFQGFTRQDRKPSHSMYHAMFEKLIYWNLIDNRFPSQEILAGDTKEPLPLMDDNISKCEKLRIQPPGIDALFSRMIRDGIHPSGRLLEMLIGNAPSLEKVAMYMHHGVLPSNTFIELMRIPSEMRLSALEYIPDGLFMAFIKFLCRPRRRKIITRPQKIGGEGSLAHFRFQSDPLMHAFELVRRRRSSPPVAWYSIFRGLARYDFIFALNRSQHVNDATSWQLLEAVLGEFLEAGIPLDPDGFRYICIGLEKALRALPHVCRSTASHVENGSKLVKEAFASLIESGETGYGPPKLLHRFAAHHLHSYVRVLGYLKDTDEMTAVLEWMVKHQEELTAEAYKSRDPFKLLRKAMVAVRAFFDSNDNEQEVVDHLRSVMDQLDSWGGWPTDDEVEQYRAYEDILGPWNISRTSEKRQEEIT